MTKKLEAFQGGALIEKEEGVSMNERGGPTTIHSNRRPHPLKTQLRWQLVAGRCPLVVKQEGAYNLSSRPAPLTSEWRFAQLTAGTTRSITTLHPTPSQNFFRGCSLTFSGLELLRRRRLPSEIVKAACKEDFTASTNVSIPTLAAEDSRVGNEASWRLLQLPNLVRV